MVRSCLDMHVSLFNSVILQPRHLFLLFVRRQLHSIQERPHQEAQDFIHKSYVIIRLLATVMTSEACLHVISNEQHDAICESYSMSLYLSRTESVPRVVIALLRLLQAASGHYHISRQLTGLWKLVWADAFNSGSTVEAIWILHHAGASVLSGHLLGFNRSRLLPASPAVLGPVHARHIDLQLKLILKHLLTIFEIQSTSNMVG